MACNYQCITGHCVTREDQCAIYNRNQNCPDVKWKYLCRYTMQCVTSDKMCMRVCGSSVNSRLYDLQCPESTDFRGYKNTSRLCAYDYDACPIVCSSGKVKCAGQRCEKNPKFCELPSCNDGGFRCESGHCVRHLNRGPIRCDSVKQCNDGSDEWNCGDGSGLNTGLMGGTVFGCIILVLLVAIYVVRRRKFGAPSTVSRRSNTAARPQRVVVAGVQPDSLPPIIVAPSQAYPSNVFPPGYINSGFVSCEGMQREPPPAYEPAVKLPTYEEAVGSEQPP